MANISFNLDIPEEDVERVTRALCATFGYQPQLPDNSWHPTIVKDGDSATPSIIPNPNPPGTVPNPQTPAEFARQSVIDWLQRTVKAFELQEQMDALRAAADATPGPQII